MNLHIMHYSNNENIHTVGMVRMIDSIDYVNNTVLFLDNSKFDAKIIEAVKLKQIVFPLKHNDLKAHFELAKTMEEYDRIYLHSFSLDFMMVCIILLFYRKLFTKLFWIAYGVDLYEWDKTIPHSFPGNIKRNAMYLFRSKVGNFVGIFKPDIKVFKDIFRSKANVFYAPYIGIQYSDAIRAVDYSVGHCSNSRNLPLRIQIGHQGNRLLHQIEVIDFLARYKDENIELFLPLNYGDLEYCQEVKKHAIDVFGSKAIILDDFIPLSDYYMLLTKVDIAIFYSERQIGLGNIYPLMYYGKKIFFKNPSPMLDFFSKQGIQCPSFDLEQKMSFDSFIEEVDVTEEISFAEELLSKDNLIKAWKTVLDG